MLGRGFGKEGVDRLARARTERPPLAPAAAAGTTLGARRAVTSGKPLRDMHAASPSTGALYQHVRICSRSEVTEPHASDWARRVGAHARLQPRPAAGPIYYMRSNVRGKNAEEGAATWLGSSQ